MDTEQIESSAGSPADPKSGFRGLVEAMRRSSRPLALLGAGTSVDSGYPDWPGLLAALESSALGKISPKYKSFIRNLNDPAWQAEEYRRLIGEEAFRNLIATQFAPKEAGPGPILQSIVDLQFRHILTTNYDSCIERAYERSGIPLQVVDWTEETKLRRFFLDLSVSDAPYLVYLHGRYYDPGNVVLTETSYANRYVRSDDAQRKLFAILITQPVVFIGFSVNDPDLNHLMREVNARLGVGNPQHFALIGFEVEEQRQLISSRFVGKYGIQPVFYRITRDPDGRENHARLLELLKMLHEEVHGPRSTPAATAADLARVTTRSPEPAAPVQPSSGPVDVYDALDQQKGRWGGMPESNGRRLKVENISEQSGFCGFDLVVESVDKAAQRLAGEVVFHLHQTFPQAAQAVKAVNGEARLGIAAYGAFTVGAAADGGNTRLELDLSQLDAFPRWFRDS